MAVSDEALVFLVGTTRSGTSLLGLMLRNHPDVSFPGEFEFALDPLDAGDPAAAPPGLRAALAMDRHVRHHRLAIDAALPAPLLLRDLLLQMKRGEGSAHKPLTGVAVHRHFDRLVRLFPDARFLHLVRDPRDVARSWIEFGWAGNAWGAARGWRTLETLWSDVERRIPRDRVFTLRFEELVHDPPKHLAEVCAFLGVPYTDAMLRYHERSTYAPVDPKQVAKWRSALTPREQRLVEAALGDLLVARGYERCGLPPIAVGPIFARWLALDDWVRRARTRMRIFGWRLSACDWVARRLGLRAWHERLELERQSIINASLK
jgi:hypothetical protein